ncbi:hypothetical protein [Sulfitobacter sp.]|uniref:hypothetical protein n=1 Tax=Sulfitobacter sp. TaxID=1903071 RepID=UPI0030039E0F
MTAVADHFSESAPMNGAVRSLGGGRLVLRLVMRIGACASLFVALLIWVTPSAGTGNNMMLFKLLVSSLSVLVSIACWQAALPPPPPSVEIDVVGGELCLIRESAPASQRIIERCSFAELEDVELKGRSFTFCAKGGRLLAEISLSNATAHATLLHKLRVAGKIS